MKQALGLYQEVHTRTANPAELVVMLYEGAVRFLRQALIGMEDGDIEKVHNSLVRAQRIIEELEMAVDPRHGPIGDSLTALYRFMLSELELANVRKERARVQPVVELLEELLGAWREAGRHAPVATAAASPAPRG
ncbi:MAG: flagellar export chaperone FliS [Chloroflexi bacterium]|nr:flagellar export chaperone FliS [Chloroflexota bacterium]